MVIGYIEYFILPNHAKIKVLAFKKGHSWVKDLSEIKENFQPEGYVFEPGFNLNNNNYNVEDFIVFEVVENFHSTQNQDLYRIKGKVKYKLEYEVIYAPKKFLLDDYSINYEYIQSNFADLPNSFYLRNSKGFYGLFVKDINNIRSHKGTIINFYKNLEENIISYKDKTYLFISPVNNDYIVDFSSEDQLISWFKNNIKSANLIDNKILKEFSKYLKNLSSDDDKVNKSRLSRIKKHFSKISFTFKELKDLVSLSPDLKSLMDDRILAIKEEILKESKSEIDNELDEYINKAIAVRESIKSEIQDLKKKLKDENKLINLFKISKDLDKTVSEITDFLNSKGIVVENKGTSMIGIESQLLLYKEFGNIQNKIFVNVNEKLESLETEIEHKQEILSLFNLDIEKLTNNRAELISNFRLFLDVTAKPLAQNIEIKNGKSYTIEKVINISNQQISDEEFEFNFIQSLKKRNICGEIRFQELKKIIATFNCTFTANLEVILSFIEATNNAIYSIIQVEPKWLSFKDLVENGLEEIWESAYEKPEILHFIILRDINISSPECYVNPLLDLDRGFRSRLPYIEKQWPINLRIISTIQPVPDVGLSILKSTFYNWGGLPPYDLPFTSEIPNAYKQKILSVEYFNSWKSDRDVINNFLDDYIS